MKHYALGRLRSGDEPYFLFRVRLDLEDVRSGYRGSDNKVVVGEWLDDPLLQWTTDMVSLVKGSRLREVEPPRPLSLPEFAEEKVVSYLYRFGHFPIWQNRPLELFSLPGESKDEFRQRCQKSVMNERDRRLWKFRDVFLHRFLRLERKLLSHAVEEAELLDESDSRFISRVSDLFSRIREDFSRCLMREDLEPMRPDDLAWQAKIGVEFQERLDRLKLEFLERLNEATADCRALADEIDPYYVPVSPSNIHVTECAICWGKLGTIDDE